MNKSMAFLVGTLLLGGAAWSQGQPPADGEVEKTIAALELQWLQAAQANNPGLVAANYDDRVVITDSNGLRATKADGAAYLKTTTFSSAQYEDLQVAVFGRTAIASGVFNAKGTYSSGNAFTVHERWTDTWVRRPNGRWVCVASHSSSISPDAR